MGVFSEIKRLGYLYGTPPLDNFIFKLCYRWTVLLLVVFSFVITCKLWFGFSFICLSDSVSDVHATAKCYDNSFTLPKSKKEESPSSAISDEKHRRYQNNYSWVNLLFLVHAFNFYLPHLLWQSYERGHMYRLTAGVQKYLDEEKKRNLKLCHLAKYVTATQGKHKLYTLLYIFFEIVNFVISLSHTFWLVHFFNVTGVPDSSPALSTWSDFKDFYFPSDSQCIFEKQGASGAMQSHSAMCILPLNGLYMKMFLFLHAWYITMTVLTGLMLAYRISLVIPSIRAFITKISSPFSVPSILKSICHQLSYSDWFFLSKLQNAMTDVDFAQMLDKIATMSQGDDPKTNEYNSFTVLNDATTEFDNSNITSPL